jgi:hypothetical protein
VAALYVNMHPGSPIIIPSYNGARKMANLTALLALLLARGRARARAWRHQRPGPRHYR